MATPKKGPQRPAQPCAYAFSLAAMLEKVKANLRLEYSEEDELVEDKIRAAVAFAERNQHNPYGYYQTNPMRHDTEQAVVLLASHWFENRDGANDRSDSWERVRQAAERLLAGDREPVM